MSLEQPQSKIEKIRFDPTNPDHHQDYIDNPEKYIVHQTHNPEHDREEMEKKNELTKELAASPTHPIESPPDNKEVLAPAPETKTHSQFERMKDISTNVADFIPILGSAKMMMEGIKGEQYGTHKKLEGKARAVHTLSGGAFLLADITGVGIVASELGKLGLKIGGRIIEKQSLSRVVENKLLKEEGSALLARGEERVDKKEHLANA
jgi:hypothetical protein